MFARTPVSLYAFAAAVVGGVLLAIGSYLGGAVLVAIALVFAWGRYVVDSRGEDDTQAPPF